MTRLLPDGFYQLRNQIFFVVWHNNNARPAGVLENVV